MDAAASRSSAMNFYTVLGSPEILGPDFCPFHTALGDRAATAVRRCARPTTTTSTSTPRRCAKPDGPPQHLIVTVRDVTNEVLQQQKLAAIHQAGIELADLTPDELAHMTVEERIELLKSNILHYTQDLLQFRRRRDSPARSEDRPAGTAAGGGHGPRGRRPRAVSPSRRTTA